MLLPGATATEFFERERGTNTKGVQGKMDDPADVARVGLKALMNGESDVIYGAHNRKASAETKKKSDAENAQALADVLRPI